MIISHSLAAMNSQRVNKITVKAKSASTEKLSSGYRINRAADDAAGLSISEKMRRLIRGLNQGIKNTQEGVSVCQVADGALAEVGDMLHRMKELAVQAANDTNTASDRNAIQKEVSHILKEIDRIGDTTTFNEIPLFKGTDNYLKTLAGVPVTPLDMEFKDFVLADVSLGHIPFDSGDGSDTLRLRAIVNKENSIYNGYNYNLIYGNGSTTASSFRITDKNGVREEVMMGNLQPSNYAFDGMDTWSRQFSYSSGTGMDVTITQKVKVEDSSEAEKHYAISYEFTQSEDVDKLEFMFHADTAYNNNDICEGYFINGQRIEQFCIYSKQGSDLTDGASSSYVYNGTIPADFSIVDVDNALAFSEKVTFGSELPDSFSIGLYYEINTWEYYDNLDSNLGHNANRKDLGFCLYYDLSDTRHNNKISFNYGIVSTEKDVNLKGVSVKRDNRQIITSHSRKKELWIQSGSENRDGLFISFGELNTSVLGINQLNVSTTSGAQNAISSVRGALHEVSGLRSSIGAQQNRLEHIIANESNTVENTVASESRIRDTDMAEEMMRYSNLNILVQSGISMMAQANQSIESVLTLLA